MPHHVRARSSPRASPSPASRSLAASSRRTRSSARAYVERTIDAAPSVDGEPRDVGSGRRGSARLLYWRGHPRRDDDRVLHVPRLLPDVLGRVPRLEDRSAAAEAHAHAGRTATTTTHDHARRRPRRRRARTPHESPLAMTVPLIVLAAFALVGGFFNAELAHRTTRRRSEHWLEPVFEGAEHVRQERRRRDGPRVAAGGARRPRLRRRHRSRPTASTS